MILYSRVIGALVGSCLIVILLTYRSFETNYTFYLSWLAGLVTAVLFVALSTYRLKVGRVVTMSLAYIMPWVIIGIFFSVFAYDKHEHFKTLIVSTFYMVTSVFVADLLIQSRISLKKYAHVMLFVWVIINLTLLVLFFWGIYNPPKFDFSGVFHDRNVFSITTLLVIGFAASHWDSKRNVVHKLAIVFSFSACILMILISKSITGLLGLSLLMLLYSFRLSLVSRVIFWGGGVAILAAILFTDNPISVRIARFAIAISGDADSLRASESAYIRLFLIKNGFELFAQHPWVGVGLNNAKEFVIWPNRDVGSFLHNNYLDILTSGGLPLFIFYYLPIFYCLLWLLKYRKKVKCLLDDRCYELWRLSFVSLILKLVYDMTWTTYFEFFMVFSVMCSIYIALYLRSTLKKLNHQAARANQPIPVVG